MTPKDYPTPSGQQNPPKTTLDHALALAARGFWVFPAEMTAKGTKKPAFKGWQEAATRDPAAVTRWWTERPEYMIGVYTGKYQDDKALLVVDVDVKPAKGGKAAKDGWASIRELEELGLEFPPTLTVASASGYGGVHMYYVVDEPLRQGTNTLGEDVDTRSKGGFVVGAGSAINGREYVITNDMEPVPCPEWLAARLGRASNEPARGGEVLPGIDPARAMRRARQCLKKAPRSVKGKGGNFCAYKVAARLKDYGLDADQSLEAMFSPEWDEGCGWSPERLLEVIQHVHRYSRNPRGCLAPEAIFTVVEMPPALREDPVQVLMGQLKRTKDGRIAPVVGNLLLALQTPEFTGQVIGFDEFKDELVLAYQPGQWQPFKDAHYARLQVLLESKGFAPIGREALRDMVRLVAEDNAFDTAQVWINSLTWDGVRRVETFLHKFLGAEDIDYTRAVSRYMWTAMAGRVLEPGCKADMVPVLVGQQGVGKSTAVAALVPDPKFFCEVSFHENEADLARKMRGVLVGEIGELRGLQTREIESIKSFITRTHEKWIGKFKEFASEFPRRLLFVGTTNVAEFLGDETGNRRWLPVEVTRADVQGIRAMRDQLWAEGAVMFKATGVAWKDAQELAAGVHENHKVPDDPWTDRVAEWLATAGGPALAPGAKAEDVFGASSGQVAAVTTSDVLRLALGIDFARQDQRMQRRAGVVLRSLGYQRKKVRTGDGVRWAYVPHGVVAA